jgi:hypothetical protein
MATESYPTAPPQLKPPKTTTLKEAMSYDPSDSPGDVAKGLLAVSYLLDSLSDAGNECLDGPIALGLCYALRAYSNKARILEPPFQSRLTH